MHILVVGAQGQLGAAVVHELEPHHDVRALTHADLDVVDDEAVARVIAELRPDAIVNAASFNDVDRAEEEPIAALNTNAFGVRALARAAAAIGATLVHYSTDFVFDGSASEPYSEDDRPHPHSVYAASKLLGEWFAADVPSSYVLRVESLFGRAPGSAPARGSVAGILKRMRAGEDVPVFEDRTVSPTYVVDAAAATRQVLERRPAPGLYHCVNTGALLVDGVRARDGAAAEARAATRADSPRSDEAPGRAARVLRPLERETGGRRDRDADVAGCARALPAGTSLMRGSVLDRASQAARRGVGVRGSRRRSARDGAGLAGSASGGPSARFVGRARTVAR